MLRRCMLAVLLAALALPLLAQKPNPPDLSGTWKLSLEKSRLPKQHSEADTIVISCSGANIAIHSTDGGRQLSREYIADGKSRIVDPGPRVGTEVKAYWKKSVLTVERIPWPHGTALSTASQGSGGHPTVAYVPVPETTQWTLSQDGLTLKRQINFGDSMETLVYDKQ